MAGGFLGLDENKIKIQVGGKPILIDRSGVVAFGFDPSAGQSIRVRIPIFSSSTLKDGSRLGVTDARLDDSTVLATTRFGVAVKFSLNELVRVHIRSKSIVYLSEREPFRVSVRSLRRADTWNSGRSDG